MRAKAGSLSRALRRRLGGADPATAEVPREPRRKPGRTKTPAGRSQRQDGTSDAVLLRALQRGTPLQEAVLVQLRTLMAAHELAGAQAMAESLRAAPQTEELGRLACGIVAFRRGFVELAWEHLRSLPDSTWARFAATEYVRAGLARSAPETLQRVGTLVAEPPLGVTAETWFELLRPIYGYGDEALARQLLDALDEAIGEQPGVRSSIKRHSSWLRPWVTADASSPTAPRGEFPTFAVIDYGHPNMNAASTNIGDHIQSIASLGHLVRHQNVRLHGEQGLVDLLDRLRVRTRQERRLEDVEADLRVMTVNRDVSMYDVIPEGTWALCFGWYMSPLFAMRYGFPLHSALRPIFVSFHCNRRELLTEEAVDYLRRYGPVGCRDWTTVYLLLSVGVPAFFSGCVTTTISTVFPDLADDPPSTAPVAYVDVSPGEAAGDVTTYKHLRAEIAGRSFAVNAADALGLLETYRREHSGVVTSRLHCYLPLRSIGVNVDFRPSNRSDIRFDGLIDITDAQFDAIRTGISAKLEQVFTRILGGAAEDEVYALWRELTAEEVTAAEARRAEPPQLPAVPPDVRARIAQVAEEAVTNPAAASTAPDPAVAAEQSAVHCAVHLPKGSGRALEVLVSSLAEHVSRPLHVWVLADHQTLRLQKRMAAALPSVTTTWVRTRGLRRGLTTPAGDREFDVDNLMLCSLIPAADRLVVLPVDSLATADIAELAEMDLGGHLLAAPAHAGGSGASGFGVIHRAALRLQARTSLSASLRRTAHARHEFDFDSFATDVMVMDLQGMRSDGFEDQALALVAEFGLDAPEVLHYVFGPDHAVVPPRWWHVPTRSLRVGTGLTHWADKGKPWMREFTPERDLWRAQQQKAKAT